MISVDTARQHFKGTPFEQLPDEVILDVVEKLTALAATQISYIHGFNSRKEFRNSDDAEQNSDPIFES